MAYSANYVPGRYDLKGTINEYMQNLNSELPTTLQTRVKAASTTYPMRKTTQQPIVNDQAEPQQQQTATTYPIYPIRTEGSGASGVITDAVQGANRESYLASLDQLIAQNNGKVNNALKYQIQMYEEQLKAQKAALDAQKAENEAALDAEAERLAAEGYENRRQTEADSAKARANWNETANAYGLNSGTQGQAALSFANQLQSDLTALRTAEAQARAEVERQRLTLGQQYQAAIEQAQAENNQKIVQLLYQKALKADRSSAAVGYVRGPHPLASTRGSNSDTAAANELASKITGDPWEPESIKSSANTASSSKSTSSASTPQFGSGAKNEYGLSMGNLKKSIGEQLKSGNLTAAENMMNQYAGLLTKSQWNELADVYNNYLEDDKQIPKY